MSDKMNLRVSGASTMPGGDYGKVSISGSGQVTGNLRADTISCSGAAKVLGNVVTESLDCSGACALSGEVQAKQVHASGSVKVKQNFSGEEMHLSGAVKVMRTLRCKILKITGGLSVGEDVEAEESYLSGAAKIEGLLNAETIELTSNATSHIREIGCSSLKVRKEKGGWLKRAFGGYALEVNSIEADQADLEYTQAEVVRGRDVRIGCGCRVHRVEYTGTCQADEDTVAELVKV